MAATASGLVLSGNGRGGRLAALREMRVMDLTVRNGHGERELEIVVFRNTGGESGWGGGGVTLLIDLGELQDHRKKKKKKESIRNGRRAFSEYTEAYSTMWE